MLGTIELSEQEIRRLRLRAQHLLIDTKSEISNIAQLLQTICGVQAQYPFDAALALRVRMNNLTSNELKQTQIEERTIVRTWCMRGTLHLLAAEDFHWLIGLHGKTFIQKSQRRYEELGLNEKLYSKSIEKLYAVLAQSEPLTRDEVIDCLMTQGINLEGQASYHLLRRAALDGLICFGPDRDGDPTYVLVENWLNVVSQPLSKEEALAKLARRYLEAYGPASLADLANWSGLPMKALRQGWESISHEMIEVRVADRRLSLLETHVFSNESKVEDPTVLLVPAYDSYLLGYHDRELILAAYAAKDVYRGGGLLRPAILIDGYIVGSWEIKRYQRRIEVRINALREIVEPVQNEISIEVQNVGKFLGMDAELIL